MPHVFYKMRPSLECACFSFYASLWSPAKAGHVAVSDKTGARAMYASPPVEFQNENILILLLAQVFGAFLPKRRSQTMHPLLKPSRETALTLPARVRASLVADCSLRTALNDRTDVRNPSRVQ